MLRDPIVANVVRAGSICLRGVQMKWQELSDRRAGRVRGIGLLEGRALIGKSADTSIASKVVIKRPVFLSQDHHMLDVSDFRATRRNTRNQLGSAAPVQSQRSQLCNRRRTSQFEQFSASQFSHWTVRCGPRPKGWADYHDQFDFKRQ